MAGGTGPVNSFGDARASSSSSARLTHPGPVADARAIVRADAPHRDTTSSYPPGHRCCKALQQLLDETGCASANGQLVGGELREFSYYIPDLGPVGGPVANFSRPYLGEAPGRMIRGGITIGRRDGEVFCHSHSLFVDAGGIQRAGHLIPEKVILGEGVRAQVWGGPDVVVEMQPDLETQMTLFTPRRVADTGRGDVAAVVCRIRPNVDLVGMVESITEDQGWEGADVRGQVGSLVGGRLEQPDGSVVTAAGPATEVMFLDGDRAPHRRQDDRGSQRPSGRPPCHACSAAGSCPGRTRSR